MRASRYICLTLALALFAVTVLTLAPGTASGQDHSGPLANTANELAVVVGRADAPLGIVPEAGTVLVVETLHFESADPARAPDYGIVHVPPALDLDPSSPRLLAYRWDYYVANYTVVLSNVTDGFLWNLTGVVNSTVELDPVVLNPDEPAAPHPRVNATYGWQVLVVNDHGHPIMTIEGGSVTLRGTGPTVLDLSPMGPPPLGNNTWVPDDGELASMSTAAFLEEHPSLTQGFYRLRIGTLSFQLGVSLTVEVRYRTDLDREEGVVLEKLLFTPRPVRVEVYAPSDLEVRAFSAGGVSETPLPPVDDPGTDATVFLTSGTFRLELAGSGDEGTDWGQVGRYALLFGVIILMLALILWTGPKKKEGPGADEDEEGDEEEEGERAELEERKEAIMDLIRELDRAHDDGELDDDEWEERRSELKAEAVEVMTALDDLTVAEG